MKQNGNKVSSLFVGTKDKCVGCSKTVYPLEKVLQLDSDLGRARH